MDTTTTTVSSTAISPTAQVDARIKAFRDGMKALNAERQALLPKLSTDERKLVIEATVNIEVSHEAAAEAAELRKNRQQSEEDRDQIAAARLEHKKLINTPAMKAEAAGMIAAAYLASYKLTHRKDGRIGVSIRGQI